MDCNIYQKLYKKELTKEEILEANGNLMGFIELLMQIDKEQRRNDRHNSVKNSRK